MIRYHLLQSFRKIKRDKTSFSINLIGLSTGLASAILIFLWVKDELSVDKFHENDKQLYQVMVCFNRLSKKIVWEETQGLLAQSLVAEMPEIEYTVSVIDPDWHSTRGIITYENKQIKAKEQYVGKDYFNMFSYDIIQGDKDKILNDKYSVLLSDEIALKLFNSLDNIVGESIDWKRDGKDNPLTRSYIISGIFKKPSANSSVQFDAVFSYASFFEANQSNMESWGNQNPYTYLTLKKGSNVEQFNAKIKNYLITKLENTSQTLFIRPYSDKYLYNTYENGVQAGGRIIYVKLFSLIALFILIIACINFMNLSTAMASKKAKEVGIKKVIGSSKKSLIFQFMSESLIIVFISLIVAIGLVLLLFPTFNDITGKQLTFNIGFEGILFVLAVTVLTGAISGSYPSFYLSSFTPAIVLKSKLKSSFGESFIRKGLVIFQFTVSAILIFSTIVIYNQFRFMQTKNLGYDRDNVICFKKEGNIEENVNAFLSEIKNISGVINTSISSLNLTNNHGQTTTQISFEGNEGVRASYYIMGINYDFIETLGMELKEGRSFSRDYGSEQSKVIFNESAIKQLGIKNPVGKRVNFWDRDWEIIGVVKDFNLESLHNKIEPFFFRLMASDQYGKNIWVKIQAGTEISTIEQIKKTYNKFNPELSFEFRFLDDDYQAMYESENRIATLSRYFSIIAIIISCLGIFGLAAFTIQKRTKEIGVRKVHGSTAFGIINLITTDFTKLVVLSLLIAFPIGYIIINNWLANFAYRIELKWWMFIGTGLTALFIALISVGMQALKAANINPAICLKDE